MTQVQASLQVQLGDHHAEFTIWTPDMGRVFKHQFAIDTETTEIIETRPDLVPTMVLASACGGTRGVFISPDSLGDFLDAHTGESLIFHNAAFDLKVLAQVIAGDQAIYELVERNQVWDTMILRRLLALATEGNTARGQAGLANCAYEFLNLKLSKRQTDDAGADVRTGFGRFIGRPLMAIPADSLRYAAMDAMATWHLFWELNKRIRTVLQESAGVFGYVDEPWLRGVVNRFGPLTHHIQLRASILMDEITRNGIAVDPDRVSSKSSALEALTTRCLSELNARGYRPGEKGNTRVLQDAIESAIGSNPTYEIPRTKSDKQWSTTKEHLERLVASDPFFASFLKFRHAQKLQNTYLAKMGKDRVHPRFGYLLATGRTYCGGGLNLQNLPREDALHGGGPASPTIRSAFVPGEGNVFIDADLSQIELVMLAYVLRDQLKLGDSLAELINSGKDVHRLIAATVLNKQPDEITKAERSSAKPVSFGRPGGMGAGALQRIATLNYGLDLSLDEVANRINAYHRLCPELDRFLEDDVNSGMVLAERLRLTPLEFSQAIGDARQIDSVAATEPAGWLGGMLLKVLAEPHPTRRNGLPYTDVEIGYFWSKAQPLADELSVSLAEDLLHRRASKELSRAVANSAGVRPVMTATGRLRANATFCASRNTLFQGAAADGAILGLWRIWRAGFKVVAFIHDQVVVETPNDEDVADRLAQLTEHMKLGFVEVTPSMRVGVEAVVTRSLDKSELASIE